MPELAHRIIDGKGWACYATLVTLRLHLLDAKRRTEDTAVELTLPQAEVDEFMKMCGCDNKVCALRSEDAASSGEWVFNRQHNGLGNQLFQYAFSRLLAESTGRQWTTVGIYVRDILFWFFILCSILFPECNHVGIHVTFFFFEQRDF